MNDSTLSIIAHTHDSLKQYLRAIITIASACIQLLLHHETLPPLQKIIKTSLHHHNILPSLQKGDIKTNN